jgi:hypothetical protein
MQLLFCCSVYICNYYFVVQAWTASAIIAASVSSLVDSLKMTPMGNYSVMTQVVLICKQLHQAIHQGTLEPVPIGQARGTVVRCLHMMSENQEMLQVNKVRRQAVNCSHLLAVF